MWHGIVVPVKIYAHFGWCEHFCASVAAADFLQSHICYAMEHLNSHFLASICLVGALLHDSREVCRFNWSLQHFSVRITSVESRNSNFTSSSSLLTRKIIISCAHFHDISTRELHSVRKNLNSTVLQTEYNLRSESKNRSRWSKNETENMKLTESF